MPDAKGIFEAIRSAPVWVLAAASVATTTPLLLPGPLSSVGLTLAPLAKTWLGVAWLLVQSLIVGLILDRISARFHKKREDAARAKTQRERLLALTPDERGVLRAFLKNERRASDFDQMDGAVISLERDGIISKEATFPNDPHYAMFKIASWAWSELHEHPDLVGL